jgi:aryl-alcohol dehydrogenase-like predicted oxidoreductase
MASSITRREFVKRTAAGALALTALPASEIVGPLENKPGLERRPLGRTGFEATILGLGTAQIGSRHLSRPKAVEVIEAAIDLGINYIDTASTYGNAEDKVGEVMRRRRDEVWLSTKALRRPKAQAAEEIRQSLKRLQTDRVDLLQIHAVNDMETLEYVLSEEGSLAAAIEAQKAGMVRYIGITGHRRPDVIAAALKRHSFATALVPISPPDKGLHDFERAVFPTAAAAGAGVIAMKVLAGGRVTERPALHLRYVLGLPVSLAIVGMQSVKEVEENVGIATSFQPLSEAEEKRLLADSQRYATTDVLWWKR